MTDGRDRVRARHSTGNLRDARSLCQQLIDTGQDAWDLLAEIEQDEGRYARAIAAWDRAIALGSRPGPTRTAKANLLLDLGRIDEAAGLFEQALAVAPEHGPALYGRASIASFRGEPVDVADLESRLAGLGGEDRVHVHFALGRAYLDRDDPARAFPHFQAGNGLRRAGYAYDVADDERLMAALAAAFPPEAFTDGAGATSERPIFIVGMPRSGSSLLEQILAAHPEIHGAGELLQLKRLVIETFAGQEPFPAVMATQTPAQRQALGRRYLDEILALAPDARRIVDKLPLNLYFAGLIHRMLPNARIIHLRRDPLDTCLSCYTTLFREPMRFTHDLTELGRFHRVYRRLMAHWRWVLPADRFVEVEYGRLTIEPEPQVRRLLEFCGVGWDAACLSPHESGRAIRTARDRKSVV